MSATPENTKPVNGTVPPPITPPEQRRGPGRPRKDGSQPGSPRPDVSTKSEKPNKRRGKVSFDETAKLALAMQIQGLHQVAALTTGIPELALHEKEAQGLAAAVANVCEEYDLSLDGKTGALIQLAAACGMIYVPRFFAMQARVNKAQQEKEGLTIDHGDVTAH